LNTLAFSDHGDEVIRVFVDPNFWHAVEAIPPVFEGYRVRVERRNPTLAQ
jgi:hypothetical protein